MMSYALQTCSPSSSLSFSFYDISTAFRHFTLLVQAPTVSPSTATPPALPARPAKRNTPRTISGAASLAGRVVVIGTKERRLTPFRVAGVMNNQRVDLRAVFRASPASRKRTKKNKHTHTHTHTSFPACLAAPHPPRPRLSLPPAPPPPFPFRLLSVETMLTHVKAALGVPPGAAAAGRSPSDSATYRQAVGRKRRAASDGSQPPAKSAKRSSPASVCFSGQRPHGVGCASTEKRQTSSSWVIDPPPPCRLFPGGPPRLRGGG
jgi:hypothetical protein